MGNNSANNNTDVNNIKYDSNSNNIGPNDYVDILRNCLFFSYNILIAKGFEQLDKDKIISVRGNNILARDRMTVDIWPLNILHRINSSSLDPSIELSLLLGYILKQTDIWTRCTSLRVKSIVYRAKEKEAEKKRLKTILEDARIKSIVHVVSLDELDNELISLFRNECGGKLDNINFSKFTEADKFRIANQVIKTQSEKTAVTFIPLPPWPTVAQNRDLEWIESIDLLVAGLPPTILVYACSQVLSKDL